MHTSTNRHEGNVLSGSRWWVAFGDRTLVALWRRCSRWCCNPPAGTWWPSPPRPASAGWRPRCTTACGASGPARSSSTHRLPPLPPWWPPPLAAGSTSLGWRWWSEMASKLRRMEDGGMKGLRGWSDLHLWTPGPSAGRWRARCRSRWGGPGRWGSQKPGWSSLRRCSFPTGPAWGRHRGSAAASESGTRKRWSLGCCRHILREHEMDGWVSGKDTNKKPGYFLPHWTTRSVSVPFSQYWPQCRYQSNQLSLFTSNLSYMTAWVKEFNYKGYSQSRMCSEEELTRLFIDLGHQSAVRVVDALCAANGRETENSQNHRALRPRRSQKVPLLLWWKGVSCRIGWITCCSEHICFETIKSYFKMMMLKTLK